MTLKKIKEEAILYVLFTTIIIISISTNYSVYHNEKTYAAPSSEFNQHEIILTSLNIFSALSRNSSIDEQLVVNSSENRVNENTELEDFAVQSETETETEVENTNQLNSNDESLNEEIRESETDENEPPTIDTNSINMNQSS